MFLGVGIRNFGHESVSSIESLVVECSRRLGLVGGEELDIAESSTVVELEGRESDACYGSKL